ncbi:MAG: 30S ribosomal protein S7 [Pseudomonadota bacterium]
MSRKREAIHREILPDPKFHSPLVAKFINSLMRKGKKSTAEAILYRSLELIGKKIEEEPIKVFEKAIDNVKPVIEVKSRRVGGSTYQVPVEVRSGRRLALSIRWVINYAKARSEKTMEGKLAGELMDAANNRGAAIKKKEDTHKMAEANKAFAHYRW